MALQWTLESQYTAAGECHKASLTLPVQQPSSLLKPSIRHAFDFAQVDTAAGVAQAALVGLLSYSRVDHPGFREVDVLEGVREVYSDVKRLQKGYTSLYCIAIS